MKIAHMFYRGFAVFNVVINFGISLILMYTIYDRGNAPVAVYYILSAMVISGVVVLLVLRKSWRLFLKESYSEKTELIDDILANQKVRVSYKYSALEVFFFLVSLAGLSFMIYVFSEVDIFKFRGMSLRDFQNLLALFYTISWAFQIYHAIVLLFIASRQKQVKQTDEIS